MSLVVGCSLFNGILMGADCRVTFSQGYRETHRDTVQKLILIAPTTVIGFVGDFGVATKLLVAMS